MIKKKKHEIWSFIDICHDTLYNFVNSSEILSKFQKEGRDIMKAMQSLHFFISLWLKFLCVHQIVLDEMALGGKRTLILCYCSTQRNGVVLFTYLFLFCFLVPFLKLRFCLHISAVRVKFTAPLAVWIELVVWLKGCLTD